MLLDAELPQGLWPYAYKHAIYLTNRTPTSALDGTSPFEKRFGSPPDVSHLRAWGTKVWAKKDNTAKLAPRGAVGRFVGFSEQHKDAILVYWPERRAGATGAARTDVPLNASPSATTPSTVDNPPSAPNSPETPAPNDTPGDEEAVEDPLQENLIEQAPTEELLGRGHRIRKPSALLRRIAAGEGSANGRPT
ncbi:uncharacterized protein BXZ73DRAFT_52470, partial [Epithele typhae]|uniref:uncharacterized protein n=1 Tax=Epithele typhae TaxID=378194 RepID=UPI00200773CD